MSEYKRNSHMNPYPGVGKNGEAENECPSMAGKHSAIDRLLTDIKDLLAIVELSSTVNNMASTIESLRVKVDSMSLAVDSLNAKADQVATTIGNLSEKMDKIVTTVEVLRLALQRESYFQDGQGPFVKSPMW